MNAGLHVVSGALFNHKHEVLMGFRKPTGKRPSLWELPGGKVEEGESFEYALVREWKEEMNVLVKPYVYVATAFLDMEVSFHISLYVVRLVTSAMPTACDHVELRWVDPLHAVEHLPCSPAFYLHWPHLRAWLARMRA